MKYRKLEGILVALSKIAHATIYSLSITYDTTNFFTSFNFFNEKDPTNGFVEYVGFETAVSEGLAGDRNGAIYMGVDTTTVSPASGRKSVRVTSQTSFTHGLFIADIIHMPGSICGVWPAMWLFGPNWPVSGEIDIIEGVNTQVHNTITLHTGSGCYITNEGTLESTTLLESNCNAGYAHTGCSQSTANYQNYGNSFNANGGGVYAMEWTSDHISIWFFARNQIPDNIKTEFLDPSGWGLPTARFTGGSGCNIDTYFMNNNLVFDTTFCGDWAGSAETWNTNLECSALSSNCNDYVAANPAAFTEAYWLINSIKIFDQSTSSYNDK
ncbi:concanavalin A-like lectin/glucanase domain-containing protein [Dactylonectria estremocensis]|uniref:endo-1,3(4)-beta-glucanase n=1 Tax=Dactylonectria estremocensis TaxID=1079267 RepID=A0A9P9IF05_9HYPO|nr:concanavalin A-like lectin/glucanase domain-containing protein [Dactylonectria estremocensis]